MDFLAMKRALKRDHLVEVATELFNQFGYHASGIDQIIEQAGIAKTTLYRYFNSKEELIVEVLKQIDEKFRLDMRHTVDNAANEPTQKILASFDFLREWFKDKTFYGCPFMSAAGEYNSTTSPVFQEALLHKRLMVAYFEELTRAAHLENPQQLAEEINLLHEGATAIAHINGDPDIACKAKAAARKLITNSN